MRASFGAAWSSCVKRAIQTFLYARAGNDYEQNEQYEDCSSASKQAKSTYFSHVPPPLQEDFVLHGIV